MNNNLFQWFIYTHILLVGLFVGIIFVSQTFTTSSNAFKLNNHQPVAQAGWDQAVDESALATSVDGSRSNDSDGDTLSFFWAELEDTADGCSVTDFTAAQPPVTFVNRLEDYTCTFQLTVDDGWSESQPDIVTVQVTADNDPPVLPALADMQAVAGENVYFSVQAYDPENSPVQLELANTDVNIYWNEYLTVFPSGKGIFQWQPTDEQVGQYALTLTANDGASVTEDSMSLVVEPNNTPPVFSGALPAVTLVAMDTATAVFDLAEYFFDDVADSLTYAIANLTSTVIELNGSVVTLTAGAQPLTETIHFTATDSLGQVATSNAVTITVLEQAHTDQLSYVRGKNHGHGVVTTFGSDYTSLDSWIAFESGGVVPYLVSTTDNNYVVALRRVRGRQLKLFSATGEEYDQIQLSPSLTWYMVGQIELDGNDQTVEVLLSGQKHSKLFLKILQFSTAQPVWKILLTKTLVNIPEKNSLGVTNSAVRVLKPDGMVAATWKFEL